ncbi:hypothetical protein ACLOJK_019040 [Asimina triloba]
MKLPWRPTSSPSGSRSAASVRSFRAATNPATDLGAVDQQNPRSTAPSSSPRLVGSTVPRSDSDQRRRKQTHGRSSAIFHPLAAALLHNLEQMATRISSDVTSRAWSTHVDRMMGPATDRSSHDNPPLFATSKTGQNPTPDNLSLVRQRAMITDSSPRNQDPTRTRRLASNNSSIACSPIGSRVHHQQQRDPRMEVPHGHGNPRLASIRNE